MRRLTLFFLIGIMACTACAQFETSSAAVATGEASYPTDRMLPALQQGQQLVGHYAYTLVYSEADEQPLWVAYMLTRERANGTQERSNNFREDSAIATGSAELADYRRSGYTRGHLVPAGDMKWDARAMDETFLLSNMSPQLADFNDGVWNRVEQQVRSWARKYDTVFVVTGPVLGAPNPDQIGPNCVTVPEQFYKAIYVPSIQQAIAFVVPHRGSDASVKSFAVSVDQLEALTGLDFFPELDDTLEDQLESQCCVSCWSWRR